MDYLPPSALYSYGIAVDAATKNTLAKQYTAPATKSVPKNIFLEAPYFLKSSRGLHRSEDIRAVARDIKKYGPDLPLELTLGTARKESTLGKNAVSAYDRWRSLPPISYVSSDAERDKLHATFAMDKLREGMTKFKGDTSKAAQWYNWGAGSRRGRNVLALGRTTLENPYVRQILKEEGLTIK